GGGLRARRPRGAGLDGSPRCLRQAVRPLRGSGRAGEGDRRPAGGRGGDAPDRAGGAAGRSHDRVVERRSTAALRKAGVPPHHAGDDTGDGRVRRALELVGGAALYFAAARLGLALATPVPQVSLVWPPTGLALTLLLLRGPDLWPAV